MQPDTLALLADPVTGGPLQFEGKQTAEMINDGLLVAAKSKRVFPIRDGVPCFLDEAEIAGLNRKYLNLYNNLAPFYDLPYALFDFFSRGGVSRIRLEYLSELRIKPGNAILEVSIGTGANLSYLRKDARFFGLDISPAMLKKCQKNLRKWGLAADLVLGEAENLPFKDEVFDVVFHMGGINFFNDRAKAISEMVRVAKPGTKLLIVDENERYIKTSYECTPLVRKYFGGRDTPILPPLALVPQGMVEIEFKELWSGRLYCLTFRKPNRQPKD